MGKRSGKVSQLLVNCRSLGLSDRSTKQLQSGLSSAASQQGHCLEHPVVLQLCFSCQQQAAVIGSGSKTLDYFGIG